MTGGHDDDRDQVNDDRRAAGTPMFSVREGVLPLPGPRATTRTASRIASRVGRCARAWDDVTDVAVDDMEDVA